MELLGFSGEPHVPGFVFVFLPGIQIGSRAVEIMDECDRDQKRQKKGLGIDRLQHPT
jgi:hypothetical protein